MRLNINLATQPYQDTRRLATIWAGLLALLLVTAIGLSFLVYHRWHEYRLVSHAISVEKGVLADLDAKQTQDMAILNRPENQDVRERSDFLNQLIRRKEVSWTRIFIDLEKMMPAHLRVLSVQPSLKDDQILIKMQLGGDSRDRVAELVHRMENSKTFRNSQIVSEINAPPEQRQGPTQQDPLRFGVVAEYVPAVEPTSAPATSNTAGGGK
jgi:hypothetical protein